MGSADGRCENDVPAVTPARNPIRVFFIPFFATGHIIPLVDIARLLAERGGIESTVVITPANAAIIRPTLDRLPHLPIRTLLYPFPSAEVGLPEGCENIASVPASDAEKVYRAVGLVRNSHDRILRQNRPDCVVADVHFHWTTGIARDLGIPRISFPAIGLFPMGVMHGLMRGGGGGGGGETREPSRDGAFVVPGLPGPPIEMVTSELPDFLRGDGTYLNDVMADVDKAEKDCYGVVVNTFQQLEATYMEHKKKVDPRKLWCVGPVALCSPVLEPEPKPKERGEGCLNWLGAQEVGSVVYMCFGSWCHLGWEQIREMARGLGACNHPFLWVVRDDHGLDLETEAGLGESDGGRRGLVVRGWAPQVAILNHPAVGAFVTHCGWNSVLEGTGAGLPLLTWPLVFEQFINERLVLHVLRTGVRVWDGPRGSREDEVALVPGEALAKAVARLMNGEEEAVAIRKRAKEYGEMARAAVKEGGSSYADLDRLIADLKGVATL